MGSWRRAFALQAASDYKTLATLLELGDRADDCQRQHYLQMTAEKVSKAFLASAGQQPPRVHDTFLDFVRREARVDAGLMSLSGQGSRRRYLLYLRELEPLAGEIDALAPAVDPPPHNPEYPWDSPSGPVAPVEFAFPNTRFNTPAMAKLLRFLEACLARL